MSLSKRVLLVIAVLAVVAASVIAAGCGEKTTVVDDTEKSTESADTQSDSNQGDTGGSGLYTPSYKPNGKETAVIKTSKGDITVKFYADAAPIHVANFIELAQKGFYNGTKFHRYIPGFVIQGGDPDTKNATSEVVAAEAAKGDGYGRFGVGGPGYSIKGEFDPATNPNKHLKGTLSMARSQSPDSGGSQFYFCLEALPQLDGGYTVFGQITDGLDVMSQLRAGDVIESVTVNGANQ